MAEAYRFDGLDARELAELLDLPAVELRERATSTLDIAHRLGNDGAGAGTLVLADVQTAGRGRGAAEWSSPAGTGLWITIVERPADTSGLQVLSLRVGLRSARALDRFAPEPVRVKWPNDLYVDDRKLGGILIEARWRERRLEWIAIGVGVNVRMPDDVPLAGSLDSGIARVEVLGDLIPAIRSAAAATGFLSEIELAEWNARDLARGRACTEPARGIVEGITPAGELRVALADSVARFSSGSLVLDQVK
ncbi:MAG: biotin--[acetyl-CoA-carboxylase] ligase [Gemmatimonadaceae bacterium]